MSKYNLDDFLDEAPKTDREKVRESDDDPRTNLRIAKVCRNCKYYFYEKTSKQARGYCKLPNPKEKNVNKKEGERYDLEEIRKGWLKVYMLNTCDNHEFKSQKINIDRVAKWVGVPFNPDGSRIE